MQILRNLKVSTKEQYCFREKLFRPQLLSQRKLKPYFITNCTFKEGKKYISTENDTFS